MSTRQSSDEFVDDDKLQQFFDGELTEGEAKIIDRDVARSSDEQARVDQLERLSDLMQWTADDVAANIDADAVFAKIEEGVAADKSPRLQVIEGAKKTQRTMAIVAVGLTMAAAVALAYLMGTGENSGTVATHPMDDRREVLVENDMPVIHVEAPAGTEVEHVDFGANTGTVFEVEGSEGQPLAVVWIAEEAP